MKVSRESIQIMNPSWKASRVLQRQIPYDFSFNSPFKVMLQFNSFFTTQKQIYSLQKTNILKFHSNILQFLSFSFIQFKLPWIESLSNLSNCLLGQEGVMFSFN